MRRLRVEAALMIGDGELLAVFRVLLSGYVDRYVRGHQLCPVYPHPEKAKGLFLYLIKRTITIIRCLRVTESNTLTKNSGTPLLNASFSL